MQPPMMKEVKQPDEALQQMRTVTLKVNKFIDQTMRHGAISELVVCVCLVYGMLICGA